MTITASGGFSAQWPAVTLVMMVRDPGDRELQALELVKKQVYPGEVTLQVIDSSRHPEQASSKRFAQGVDRWVSIPTESFSYGGTRQLGVELAQTPLVAFLSVDAHPVGHGWLQALVRPLVAGEAEASYGRQRSPVPDPEREATYAFLYPDRPLIKSAHTVGELGVRGFHMSSVGSAFRTDVICSVGFPRDIPTFEDVAVVKRLFEAGYRVAYVPDAVVLHAHEMDWVSTWARYRTIGLVYEHVGIFESLAAEERGGLISDGIRTLRALAAGGAANQSSPTIRGAALAVFKGAAVWRGRRIARREPAMGWGVPDSRRGAPGHDPDPVRAAATRAADARGGT